MIRAAALVLVGLLLVPVGSAQVPETYTLTVSTSQLVPQQLATDGEAGTWTLPVRITCTATYSVSTPGESWFTLQVEAPTGFVVPDPGPIAVEVPDCVTDQNVDIDIQLPVQATEEAAGEVSLPVQGQITLHHGEATYGPAEVFVNVRADLAGVLQVSDVRMLDDDGRPVLEATVTNTMNTIARIVVESDHFVVPPEGGPVLAQGATETLRFPVRADRLEEGQDVELRFLGQSTKDPAAFGTPTSATVVVPFDVEADHVDAPMPAGMLVFALVGWALWRRR